MLLIGDKVAGEKTLPQPRTGSKPGRFLETILDESAGSVDSASPVKERVSTESSPQAVTSLGWSDIKFPPNSLRTSLFNETPLEHSASSAPSNTNPDVSDVKLNPNAAVNERLNHSIAQRTPKSIKKALFEGSPQSPEMPSQQQHVTPRFHVTQQTPMSARVPLSMGPSPQLDFWLLPQDRNVDNSGGQATPMSARSDLFEETPLESGNSSFNGIEYLSRFGEQTAPETDVIPLSVETRSQPDPFRLQRGGSPAHSALPPRSESVNDSLLSNSPPELRDYTAELKLVDTREFIERLNRIKQPSLQHETNASPHSPLIDPHLAKQMPVDTAGIGGTASLLHSATREMGIDPLAVHTTPNSSQMSNFGDTRLGRGTLLEQDETIQSHSSVHQTPKPAAFFKETSYQSASSSSYEVDTSALIHRLNKIKLTQQSFTTPHYTPSKPVASQAEEDFHGEQNGLQTSTDTSLLASRLDQIKQAQKSQQVSVDANIYHSTTKVTLLFVRKCVGRKTFLKLFVQISFTSFIRNRCSSQVIF